MSVTKEGESLQQPKRDGARSFQHSSTNLLRQACQIKQSYDHFWREVLYLPIVHLRLFLHYIVGVMRVLIFHVLAQTPCTVMYM